MRVGINAQLCSPSSTYRNAGIAAYIRHLISGLGQCGGADEIHLFLPASNIEGFGPAFQHHLSPQFAESREGRIAWEQMYLPFLTRRLHIDVLHSTAYALPAICPCRSVVTVHDLSFIRFPENFPKAQRAYLEFSTRRAVRKADAVIAVSESTKSDIIRLLGAADNKVHVIHNGVGEEYGPVSEDEKQRISSSYGLQTCDILYLGTLEPRKNITMLIKAFNTARKHLDGSRLVLAGARGWFYEETFRLVEELEIQDLVRFTGYVPAEDMPALYGTAGVFIYPSLYEGFGLPPLEAMACGTPVITSNTSSLPEVVGDAGITVTPNDVEGLSDAIIHVLSDAYLRENMSRKGLERARHFTWHKTAQQTLTMYNSLYNL